jgi:hypothetical protein
MAKATLADAREVTSAIVSALDPLAVLLFGEVGRRGEGNDLDLLVVVQDGCEHAPLGSTLRPFLKRIAIDPEWEKDAREELAAAEYLNKGGFWKPARFLPSTESRCLVMTMCSSWTASTGADTQARPGSFRWASRARLMPGVPLPWRSRRLPPNSAGRRLPRQGSWVPRAFTQSE